MYFSNDRNFHLLSTIEINNRIQATTQIAANGMKKEVVNFIKRLLLVPLKVRYELFASNNNKKRMKQTQEITSSPLRTLFIASRQKESNAADEYIILRAE